MIQLKDRNNTPSTTLVADDCDVKRRQKKTIVGWIWIYFVKPILITLFIVTPLSKALGFFVTTDLLYFLQAYLDTHKMLGGYYPLKNLLSLIIAILLFLPVYLLTIKKRYSKKSKIIQTIIYVFLSFLAVGINIQQPKWYNPFEDWQTLEDCKDNTGEYIFPCVTHIADKTNDESLCPLIFEKSERNECYYWVALGKDDFELCKQITITEKELYSQSIGGTGGIGAREECFIQVAKDKVRKNDGDYSICETQVPQDYHDHCLRSLIGLTYRKFLIFKQELYNLKICNQINDLYTKTLCIHNIAQGTQNLETCNLIPNEQDIFDCRDAVYYSKAIKTHDFTYCDKMIIPKNKEDCLKVLDR